MKERRGRRRTEGGENRMKRRQVKKKVREVVREAIKRTKRIMREWKEDEQKE